MTERGLTKKQAVEALNTSLPWVEELLLEGALSYIPGGKPRRRLIDPLSLSSLVEGQHYVRCQICNGCLGQVNHMHTRACAGIEFQEYTARFPDAPVMSSLAERLRAKTPAQREAQSSKLKARFQTPEGEITRQQISATSKRMQASESGVRCQNHLRKLNSDPVERAARRSETVARWEQGALREAVEGWHREHEGESRASAAHARRFSLRKRTRPHLKFKALMEEHGVHGFLTEHEVGYYAIDEARPDLKVAVEVDGCYWHSCPQCGLNGPRENLRTDKSKTTYLINRGWSVLRFWEHEVNQDPMGCVDRVRQAVAEKERETHAR